MADLKNDAKRADYFFLNSSRKVFTLGLPPYTKLWIEHCTETCLHNSQHQTKSTECCRGLAVVTNKIDEKRIQEFRIGKDKKKEMGSCNHTLAKL